MRVEGLEKDIFVNQRATANALDGDRVEVVVTHRGRDGRMEGEVTRIVERNRRTYVGVAEVGAHQIFVKADSRRMPMDIYLSKRTCPEVRDGEKVVVRIVDWQPGSKSPTGELVERLGMAGNNDTEMHAILAEYELPYRFEPEVEQAAAAIDARITAKEIASRRDFRDTTTFTVDPADAKDFDDALSVRKVSDGVWEVGVHIADVTHYVAPTRRSTTRPSSAARRSIWWTARCRCFPNASRTSSARCAPTRRVSASRRSSRSTRAWRSSTSGSAAR